jgi:DNA repair protein RadC
MIYEAIYVKETKEKKAINKVTDVFQLMKPYVESGKEQLVLITLDGLVHIIGIYIIHVGSINFDNTDQQDILRQTLLDKSKHIAISFVTNRDILTPSKEELKITKKLLDSCKILGIKILYKAVVSEYGYAEIRPDPNNDEITDE